MTKHISRFWFFMLLMCFTSFSLMAQGNEPASGSSSETPSPNFDPRTPDGFSNPKSHRIVLKSDSEGFTIPSDKNFYITRLNLTPSNVKSDNSELYLDDKVIYTFNAGTSLCSNNGRDIYFATPLLIGKGSKLSLKGRGEAYIQGFTVDAEVNFLMLDSENIETAKIESGKTFVLMHTIKTRSCDVAYKGKFEFSSVDELHFPEFFTDLTLLKGITGKRLYFGYIY
ncbi:MAG: hypothetical protein JJT94_03060 [Bernardetiaceae bacterium]|nr:hypothetical protein [Bernardetiaceae bacterium]